MPLDRVHKSLHPLQSRTYIVMVHDHDPGRIPLCHQVSGTLYPGLIVVRLDHRRHILGVLYIRVHVEHRDLSLLASLQGRCDLHPVHRVDEYPGHALVQHLLDLGVLPLLILGRVAGDQDVPVGFHFLPDALV